MPPTDGPTPLADAYDERGILAPGVGRGRFALTRYAPSTALAPWLVHYWVIHWDLRGRAPFAQETLSHPAVNVVCGTHRPGVHGVTTARFVAQLAGEGWVVGARFQPGGFVPWLRPPWTMRALKDRDVPIADYFGAEGAALDRAVHVTDDDGARVARLDAFFARRLATGEPVEAPRAAPLVALLQGDPALVRVDQLAARAGLSVRALQRVFLLEIGVPVKSVVRRVRVQEAARRLAHGAGDERWAALAAELGYADQSHFIREFKQQIGQTPGEYARRCVTARAGRA